MIHETSFFPYNFRIFYIYFVMIFEK
jgi:hypothetical protein